jgi:membrane associated rhomboid family serine protease
MSSLTSPEPVCSRHPDRVTYVCCNRCGNGICTDCMVSAPVGFHCPTCVRKATSQIRTFTAFAPRFTYGLIGVCVALQILGFLGIGTSTKFLQEFSLYPYAVAVGDNFRLLSAIFVHSGWLHLGMNMLMLWVLGRSLEELLGPTRLLLVFVISGFGGAVSSYWFNDPNSIGIGASGAIFGLFAAMFVYSREHRANTQEIITVIGINLVLGFVIPGVDWHAHIGGLIAGAIVGWTVMPGRTRVLQVAGPALLVVVLAIAVQLRTDQLLAALIA